MDGKKIMILTVSSLKCSFVRVNNAPVKSHVPGCMFAENDKLHTVQECYTKNYIAFQKQTIIHAYVTPRLDQNNSLLGGLPLTQMNKLQLVQNSAAKIILGGKKHDHVTDHLIKLHWLPISQRRIFKILLLVFKALNGQGPIYLAEMLVPCSNSEHDLRSSYDNLLVVPATDSATYGDRAFSVLGPSLWNNLPKKIRCSSSVPSFKSALKTHLFKQSFGV